MCACVCSLKAVCGRQIRERKKDEQSYRDTKKASGRERDVESFRERRRQLQREGRRERG